MPGELQQVTFIIPFDLLLMIVEPSFELKCKSFFIEVLMINYVISKIIYHVLISGLFISISHRCVKVANKTSYYKYGWKSMTYLYNVDEILKPSQSKCKLNENTSGVIDMNIIKYIV